jgi:putative mycofactocin binding protein MftB
VRRLLTGVPVPEAAGPGPAFQADHAYEKHPRVAIRPEEFGGLAYHYDTRRLLFLKSRALVDVVESLADFPTAGDALSARAPAGQAQALAAALPRLLAAGVIRVRAT